MKGNSNNNIQNQDSGCKIFIGGLTWNTTKDMLFNEFSKYGDIVDSIVMKNPETGNSRGFGFVTYKENSSAETAVASGSHKIDGKIVDVKLCNPKLAAQQRSIKQKSDNCKVFVGGLPHGVTDDQIKNFFSRYGPVKEFKMMYDENKQRPRGFGFITFDSEECANQVLQEHYIQFNGKQIEVKPQIHNLKQQMPYQQYQQVQYQQAHFSGGNWNSNWNQPQQLQGQLGQPMNISTNSNANYMPMMHQGYNSPLPNTPGMNQQWGYQGSQPGPYNTNGSQQSNWNYPYYVQPQPQPGYYQQQPQQHQVQQQLTPAQQQQNQQSDSSGTGQQSIIVTSPETSQNHFTFNTSQSHTDNPSTARKYDHPSVNLLTSDYLQDSACLPTTSTCKQSSSSSIAGTIGSNANYSDSEASSHSYYRGNSMGSNSSIAPSVSSLTGSSIISNISNNNSNSSSSTTSSNSTNFSNQNHRRINTQTANNQRGSFSYHHRNHHHGRSGGSVASSNETDMSSVYSSMPSHLNNEQFDESFQYTQQGCTQNRQGSNYHPYRR